MDDMNNIHGGATQMMALEVDPESMGAVLYSSGQKLELMRLVFLCTPKPFFMEHCTSDTQKTV